MSNKQRGEVTVTFRGETHTMCLTLGAMAEIETALELDSFEEITAKFGGGKVGAADVIVLLGALLRGGGSDISDEEIASITPHELEGMADGITEALGAQFAEAEPEKKTKARKGSTGKSS